jgi:ribosomal protein S18 acetylase RimI-like enzyme/predicted enzyme related to lactoylglutathione lyase
LPPTANTTGLFEAHLTVSDLDRAVAFYRDIVGLTPALDLPERSATFFWLGSRGEAMLGLWAIGSTPVALALHIALKAPLADILDASERLRSVGVTPLSFFGEETTEPSVIAWMPAAAVYFRDPDGHLIEYLSMLDEPPRPDGGIVPWSQWTSRRTDGGRLRIERFTGPRSELRALFAEAEDSAAQLDGYIETGEVLVATEADRVVGHLQLVDAADGLGGEIKNMAVVASHRGRGIGCALVEAAAELARAKRRPRLVVATATADTNNLRFYQRAGFRVHSVERDAFTPAAGYAPETIVDGIALRDRVWLDLHLSSDTTQGGSLSRH